jgi:hypothetical protein
VNGIEAAKSGVRENLDVNFGIRTNSQSQLKNLLKHLEEGKNNSKANGFK